MLIGRRRETEILVSALKSDKSEFVAVFGRRRVGKTFLVQEAFGNRFSVGHTGVAKGGMRKDWHMATRRGGQLGERFLPLDRVGVYIPGGTAPLASTAVMTATLAKVYESFGD